MMGCEGCLITNNFGDFCDPETAILVERREHCAVVPGVNTFVHTEY